MLTCQRNVDVELAEVLDFDLAFSDSSRRERTITMQQIIGRVAIEEAGGKPFLLSLASDPEPPKSSGREVPG